MTSLVNAARAGLIVDLDALFDTRLAVLDHLDPLLAAHALKDNYLQREEDSFKHCPLELFKQVYNVRDNEILGKSLMTQVKNVVIDFMKDSINILKTGKTKHTANVYINVYPYKISEDAAGELLKPFYDAAGGKVNIHLVNISPKELTTEVCKKHFSYVVKYDYMDWLLELGKNGDLQRNPMNEVTLIAPRIYPSGKPDEETLLSYSRNQMEPYQCTEVFFAPFIKLELYVSQLFSASVDQNFIDSYVEEIGKRQANESQEEKSE